MQKTLINKRDIEFSNFQKFEFFEKIREILEEKRRIKIG